MNIKKMTVEEISTKFKDMQKIEAELKLLRGMVEDMQHASLMLVPDYIKRTIQKLKSIQKIFNYTVRNRRAGIRAKIMPEIKSLLMKNTHMKSKEIFDILIGLNLMEDTKQNYERVRSMLSELHKNNYIKKTGKSIKSPWMWNAFRERDN